MKKIYMILGSAVLLAGCNTLQWNSDILGGASQSTPSPVVEPTDPGVPLSAIPDETFVPDATAPETPSIVATGFSGRATTVAALGDPAVPGMWMETPLVSSEQLARLRSANGKEVTVTLKPIAGEASAGSRVSISAMRALGVPLTELVELEVLPIS